MDTKRCIMLFTTVFFLLVWHLVSSEEDGCKDKFSAEDCRIIRDRGLCTSDNYNYNCKKTCGVCQQRAALYFVKDPTTVIATEGQSVTFSCKAETVLNLKIRYLWKLNQSYIENNTFGFSYSSYKNASMLLIHKVNQSTHTGSYQCMAILPGYGSVISVPALLKIAYFRIGPQETSSLKATETRAFIIKLPQYEASPLPTFKWEFKKQGSVYIDVSSDQSIFITDRGDLMIPSVKSNHFTTYRVFVNHQSIELGSIVFLFTLREKGNNVVCADATIVQFPTISDKVAFVGDNISFECLAVATDCRNQISISWDASDGQHISTERRLYLNDIQKVHEGKYFCYVEVVGTIQNATFIYSLIVKERPKLLAAVGNNVTIGANDLLIPAVLSNVTAFSWYKDGQRITNQSSLYRIYSNNSLMIVKPSLALNGFYQMFYRNDAGFTVITQLVNVRQAGCGWRLSSQNDSLHFYKPSINSPENDVICSWLLQTDSTRFIKFSMTSFDFPSAKSNCSDVTLHLHSGPIDSAWPSVTYCNNTAVTFPPHFVRGPFVLILLHTQRGFLDSGGFLMKYQTVFSTLTTTPHPSEAVTTSKVLKNTTDKVITTREATTTTTYATATRIRTKVAQSKGGSFPIAAVIGVIISAVILAAILSLLCYKKRLWKELLPRNFPRKKNPKTRLARFHVHAKEIGVTNQSFQGAKGPSFPNIVPTLHYTRDGLEYTGNEAISYDTVGEFTNLGGAVAENDIYDAVGSTISNGLEHKPSQKSTGNSSVSNFSTLSSTKSEPFYHQLEEGINLTYESADKSISPRVGSLQQQANTTHDFARTPSGRSDSQYTPLEDESSWASKENNIYESLTLERVSSSSKKKTTQLGEYCEPCNIEDEPSGDSRGRNCVLHETGKNINASSHLGDYCEPFDEKRPYEDEEQLYSEPL